MENKPALIKNPTLIHLTPCHYYLALTLLLAVFIAPLLTIAPTTAGAAPFKICKSIKVTVANRNKNTALLFLSPRLRGRVAQHGRGGYRPASGQYGPFCTLKRDGKWHCSAVQRVCKTR